jgi:hypothetical protein
MSHTLTIPLFLAFGLAAGEPPRPQAADWLADHDAQTLKAAGIRADDAGLLAYLSSFRPPQVNPRLVRELVADLGHDDFTRRERATRRLTPIAGLARAELEQASRSKDAETARRAKAILDDYQARGALREDALPATLREVARRKTAGAVSLLLDLPAVWERPDRCKAAARALAASARPADTPALRRALNASDPHVRTAAIAAYDSVQGDGASGELRRLLTDGNEAVRLAAALALLNRGDRRAFPALGRLLDSAELPVRNRAAGVLRAVTGQDFGFVAYASAEVRARAAARWRRWIEGHGPTARLTLPAPTHTPLGKILLIFEPDLLVKLNERSEKVWQANLPGAYCCQGLPDGHRLVGTQAGEVIEYDAEGKVTWSLWGLQAPVWEVQRLENGNTLVAVGRRKEAKLREFRSDKSLCWELPVPYLSGGLQRLENGNTLVAVVPPHTPSVPRGRLVELNRWGDVVWEVAEAGEPWCVRRLENGNTLYCDTARFEWAVKEVDRGGKVVWSHGAFMPSGAERLANGHTLLIAFDVVTGGKLEEVNAAGTVVWEYAEKGVLRLSVY